MSQNMVQREGGLQLFACFDQYNHRAKVDAQLLWIDTAKIKTLHIMSETIPWVGESDV